MDRKLEIAKPLTLPSGLILPNRLVNAAMTEQMADKHGLPTPSLTAAYGAWSDGGWGMVLTGNVQTDLKYLGGPRDTALIDDEAKILESWKKWAKAAKGTSGKTPVLMQINHPGRQSPLGSGKRSPFAKTIAPSPVPLQLGPGVLARCASALVFGTPREMTHADIEAEVARFDTAARLAADAGFDGVEIHAAHGYLLAQFLSARSNVRTDAYGGTPEGRARIVVDVVKAVRAATAAHKGFTVGIKLNSVDHQSETALAECVAQLREIVAAGVDFVEISGGTYENPSMFLGTKDQQLQESKSEHTKAREAFFLEFARAIRDKFPHVPLIVTGGFRTRVGMEAAVSEGGCDMVGVGRPAVLNPTLPKSIVFNKEVNDEDARLYAKKIQAPWYMKVIAPAVGAGAESIWYSKQIGKMASL